MVAGTDPTLVSVQVVPAYPGTLSSTKIAETSCSQGKDYVRIFLERPLSDNSDFGIDCARALYESSFERVWSCSSRDPPYEELSK